MDRGEVSTEDTVADPGSPGDTPTRAWIRGFIARHEVKWEMTFAALALISVALDFGFEDASAETVDAIFWTQVGLTAIFAIEFFGRLWAAIDRQQHLREHVVDAVSIIPPVRILRLLRLLRVVRVFSGVYRTGMRWGPLAENRGFISLVSAWVVLGALCSVALYVAESEVNSSIRDPLDALWWGVGTLTTVGSDLSPITSEGRIAAMLLMLVGVFLFSAITATITSFLLSGGDREERIGPTGLATEIDLLSRLRDRGDISPDEYAVAKSRLLGTPTNG